MPKSNIPSGVTPEMLEQLVNSPGETISSSPTASSSFRPSSSIPINEGHRDVRPQIGGHVNGAEKITVSPNLAKRLAEGDEREKALKASLAAEEADRLAALEETQPEKILARLAYLERTVKTQQKQIKELLKDNDNATT